MTLGGLRTHTHTMAHYGELMSVITRVEMRERAAGRWSAQPSKEAETAADEGAAALKAQRMTRAAASTPAIQWHYRTARTATWRRGTTRLQRV